MRKFKHEQISPKKYFSSSIFHCNQNANLSGYKLRKKVCFSVISWILENRMNELKNRVKRKNLSGFMSLDLCPKKHHVV